MPVYDRTNVPAEVGRGTLDPDLAAWLPHAPVLGADERAADARRSHRALAAGPWPEVGAVEELRLDYSLEGWASTPTGHPGARDLPRHPADPPARPARRRPDGW